MIRNKVRNKVRNKRQETATADRDVEYPRQGRIVVGSGIRGDGWSERTLDREGHRTPKTIRPDLL